MKVLLLKTLYKYQRDVCHPVVVQSHRLRLELKTSLYHPILDQQEGHHIAQQEHQLMDQRAGQMMGQPGREVMETP